jgi:hypothetical protein
MGNRAYLLLIALTILLVRSGTILCSLGEDDTTANVRIVHFPEDRSVGKIIHEIDDASALRLRKSYDAQGDVLLPMNVKLKFNAMTQSPLPESVLYESLVDLDLVELKLFEADISDQDLAHVAKLTSVERLYLSGNPITDKGLVHLSKLRNLESLELPGSKITDQGLVRLTVLPSLRRLQLVGCPLTDDAVPYLSALTSLHYLNILDTHITSSGLKTLKEALPECLIYHRKLTIKWN